MTKHYIQLKYSPVHFITGLIGGTLLTNVICGWKIGTLIIGVLFGLMFMEMMSYEEKKA